MPKIETNITIQFKQGLHARPAALFVQLAEKFKSNITVLKGELEINGKSIMGLLMLGAQHGAEISIIAEGDDAQEATDALVEFLSKDE